MALVKEKNKNIMDDLIQKLFDAIDDCTNKETKDINYKELALKYFDVLSGKNRI